MNIYFMLGEFEFENDDFTVKGRYHNHVIIIVEFILIGCSVLMITNLIDKLYT